VLDIGGGSGLHALALQDRGFDVTALDVCDAAVEIMVARGVRDAQLGDIRDIRDHAFDTLLMLGHGIGMVEDLNGFDEFLRQARDLVRPGGQLLLHSIDVSRTDDPVHLAYHATRRAAGRYIGETRMQFLYGEHCGPLFGWLHVDADLIASRAQDTGWTTEVLMTEDDGDYLARLAVGRAGTSAP
jgi:SAM-dependent methyltransferase